MPERLLGLLGIAFAQEARVFRKSVAVVLAMLCGFLVCDSRRREGGLLSRRKGGAFEHGPEAIPAAACDRM